MITTIKRQSNKVNYPRFIVYWVRLCSDPSDGRFCSFLKMINAQGVHGQTYFNFTSDLPMTLDNVALFDTKCKARIAWQRDGRRDELIINDAWGMPSPKIYRISPNSHPYGIVEYLYKNAGRRIDYSKIEWA